MIDELKTIQLGKETYPYICTIGAVEKLQTQYGNIYEWNKKFIGTDEEGVSHGYVSAMILESLDLFLKEGQAVNEILNGVKKEPPEKEKLSLLMAASGISLKEAGRMIIRAVDDCFDPNLQTPNQAETGNTK